MRPKKPCEQPKKPVLIGLVFFWRFALIVARAPRPPSDRPRGLRTQMQPNRFRPKRAVGTAVPSAGARDRRTPNHDSMDKMLPPGRMRRERLPMLVINLLACCAARGAAAAAAGGARGAGRAAPAGSGRADALADGIRPRTGLPGRRNTTQTGRPGRRSTTRSRPTEWPTTAWPTTALPSLSPTLTSAPTDARVPGQPRGLLPDDARQAGRRPHHGSYGIPRQAMEARGSETPSTTKRLRICGRPRRATVPRATRWRSTTASTSGCPITDEAHLRGPAEDGLPLGADRQVEEQSPDLRSTAERRPRESCSACAPGTSRASLRSSCHGTFGTIGTIDTSS